MTELLHPPYKFTQDQKYYNYNLHGYGFVLIWFMVITVIFWFVFYVIKPSFMFKNDDSGTLDFGKVLLYSIGVGIIGVIFMVIIVSSQR